MSTTPDLSQHYERIAIDRQLKAGRALIDALAVKPGESVLELGCGTGILTEYLAERVGRDGEVLGLDPMALRISMAQQRARPNLRFQIGSAYQLARFPDGSFDAILLNGGLHKLPDKQEPLRQFQRMLKAGGRLGIHTPSKDHPHPVSAIKQFVLSQTSYLNYAEPAEACEYPVTLTELELLLTNAGFNERHLTLQPEVTLHSSANAAIEFFQATSYGRFLAHLPPALRIAARENMCQELELLRLPEGIRHDGASIMAVARKNATG